MAASRPVAHHPSSAFLLPLPMEAPQLRTFRAMHTFVNQCPLEWQSSLMAVGLNSIYIANSRTQTARFLRWKARQTHDSREALLMEAPSSSPWTRVVSSFVRCDRRFSLHCNHYHTITLAACSFPTNLSVGVWLSYLGFRWFRTHHNPDPGITSRAKPCANSIIIPATVTMTSVIHPSQFANNYFNHVNARDGHSAAAHSRRSDGQNDDAEHKMNENNRLQFAYLIYSANDPNAKPIP